jgi:hypothetical protein
MKQRIYKDVKSFTILRKKWIRGEDPEETFLLRKDDGKMCCLGFYGQACGISDRDLLGVAEPSGVNEYHPKIIWDTKLIEEKTGWGTKVCDALIRINDENSPDKVKEKKITEKFKKIGFETFEAAIQSFGSAADVKSTLDEVEEEKKIYN